MAIISKRVREEFAQILSTYDCSVICDIFEAADIIVDPRPDEVELLNSYFPADVSRKVVDTYYSHVDWNSEDDERILDVFLTAMEPMDHDSIVFKKLRNLLKRDGYDVQVLYSSDGWSETKSLKVAKLDNMAPAPDSNVKSKPSMSGITQKEKATELASSSSSNRGEDTVPIASSTVSTNIAYGEQHVSSSQVAFPHLKPPALRAIAETIGAAYKGWELESFFSRAGYPGYKHDSSSKWWFALEVLKEIQGTAEGNAGIIRIIELLCDPEEFLRNSELAPHSYVVEAINKVLKFYQLSVDDETGKVVPLSLKSNEETSTLTSLFLKDIMTLIRVGENDYIEFKEVGCIDPQTGAKGGKEANKVVRAVAGFLNTKGGVVLVGVKDKTGEIVGVESEYLVADSGKPNWDGYKLFLRNRIGTELGNDCLNLLTFTPVAIQGKIVCRIDVRPSLTPRYYGGVLPVRDSAGCIDLKGAEMVSYVRTHWSD